MARPTRVALALAGLATPALGAAAVAAVAAQEIELVPHPTRWRTTAEWVEPREGDGFLAVGLSYDLLDPLEAVPGGYVGLGGYGAVAGERDGWLVGGLTLGWRRALSQRLVLDLGAFGGGSLTDAAAGDAGFAARPHVGLELPLGGLAARLEASWWEDGDDLSGAQLALGFSNPSRFLSAEYALDDLEPLDPAALVAHDERVGARASVLLPSSRSVKKDGSDYSNAIALGSFVYERQLGDGGWYWPFELGGAFAGADPGYAQALTGVGYRFDLVAQVLEVALSALAGPAGGGGVDTGTGLVAEGRLGARAAVSREWSLGVDGGYLAAVGGGLDGPTLGLSATWSPRPLELAPDVEAERLAREGLDEEAVRLDDWDLQFLAKVLSPDGDTRAESTGAPQTDDAFLAGIGAEKPIWGPVDLSVRAFTAVAGELGGYREAGLGLKYEFDAIDLVETGRFYVQYHAGLGGGGDVDVGHGLLHQFAAGWRFAPLPGLALGVEFGHFSSDSGTFEGDSYAATVTWVLSRPAERL